MVAVALGVLLGIAAPRVAEAGVIVESTFDTDAEGWTVGNFLVATGNTAPTYVAAGGNPGGFIRTGDLFGFNAFHAPAAFLGDQSAAYGGSIHLDERVINSDGAVQAMVVLSDGILVLQFRTAPPGLGWTSYDISLLASAGWQIASNGINAGPAATEAQLQQVLGNLTFLHIDADWTTGGGDQVDLDNVSLNSNIATPEPGTIALFTLGCVGLCGSVASRRRRRGAKSPPETGLCSQPRSSNEGRS